MSVCNLVFGIPLHAGRRPMAAAPPLPKQRWWAIYITVPLATGRPSRPPTPGGVVCGPVSGGGHGISLVASFVLASARSLPVMREWPGVEEQATRRFVDVVE